MKKTFEIAVCLIVAATVTVTLVRVAKARQENRQESRQAVTQEVGKKHADKKEAPEQFAGQTGQKTAPAKKNRTATQYDPLKISKAKLETLDLKFTDPDRNRNVPVLVYLPKSSKPAPVIIHSHGLGGTKHTSQFLGEHWAARGYVAAFIQHPGSDDSVWNDVPRFQRMRAMRKAASKESLLLRVGDIPALIDQLEKWNVETKHALSSRMDLDHIGMSGHSFGAVTTQQLSGQAIMGTSRYADPRISAAIPMSPSAPRIGDVNKAFGNIKLPWLCMTGTHDVSAIGGASAADRLKVYPALPDGDKYQVVLKDAEHSVFTESKLPGDTKKRNPNHHRAIKALSTAFWDSYLRRDPHAKKWLTTDDARTVLESADDWQIK